MKNDPRLIVAARELRDRWLEQVNAAAAALLPERQARYDVSREWRAGATTTTAATTIIGRPTPLLGAA